MDKADATAREHIAKSADLIAAIRLPEGSFRADAGTDVVVDILFFRKRKPGEPQGDVSWLDLVEVVPATEDSEAIRVNRWFADHPDHVLGHHATTSGPFGETYTCLAGDGDLEAALDAAILSLPDALYDGEPDPIDIDLELCGALTEVVIREDTHVREGSFVFDASRVLMQVIDGRPAPVPVRKGRSGEGFSEKQINIVTKLIPVRDAVRAVLKAQETNQPWRDLQVKLRIAWSSFVRDFGPINHTRVPITENDAGSGKKVGVRTFM
jgi:N12 class adenine-specific DNA methylase